MKLRIKEQFISYIFVVILFLTGMCMEIPPADASFLYAKDAPVTGTTVSVIRDGSNIVSLEKVCTIDMLRRDASVYLNSKRGTSLVRRFLRITIVFLAAEMLLAQLFYFGEVADFACRKRISSHVAIVRYIQQKDGKK